MAFNNSLEKEKKENPYVYFYPRVSYMIQYKSPKIEVNYIQVKI